ncbi:hypothetical protein [Leucobacter chromiireducens]|uniref:Uncharacterized protein n=1 Tax=Leucobacter chromiireducens subsp. chromiireducens TaxID=660067 RepID=A0ABS1STR9_9MICO|nr:hypothetical protein [Leucobacter chromiireducens]MBL3690904.1 hypothetical protein [Leucobacter chromiireducens subsp. chromiireducens]
MGDTDAAQWTLVSGGAQLRFTASRVRAAYSPGFLAVCAFVGVTTGGVAGVAGSGLASAVLVAILVGGVIAALVGYFRLSTQARPITLTLSGETATVSIGGDSADRTVAPLAELRRIVIVHDGAPARVVVDAAGRRERWTVGQLHRNNRPEEHLPLPPAALVTTLRGLGLRLETERVRGIRTTTILPA